MVENLLCNQNQSVRQLITEQLEQLLNSRTVALTVPEDAPSGSLTHYGLPGFSQFSWMSESDQRMLCRLFAKTIQRQVPLLSKVEVIFLGHGHTLGVVQLKIIAQIKGDQMSLLSTIDMLRQRMVSVEESYG